MEQKEKHIALTGVFSAKEVDKLHDDLKEISIEVTNEMHPDIISKGCFIEARHTNDFKYSPSKKLTHKLCVVVYLVTTAGKEIQSTPIQAINLVAEKLALKGYKNNGAGSSYIEQIPSNFQ